MKANPHFGDAPPHFRADKVLQVTLGERSMVRGAGAAPNSEIIQGNLFLGDMDTSILISELGRFPWNGPCGDWSSLDL